MRKIIVLSYLTLDGFTAAKDGGSKWIVWDEGLDDYYIETQRAADAIIFGRTTFESLKDFWSTDKSKNENAELIEFINAAKKYVFSKSLDKADWNNSEIVRDITREEIQKLKTQAGKNILIIGSGSIASQLQNLNLIDEYRFVSLPVALGEGKPYFTNLDDKLDLRLIETKNFKSGSVLHRYEPRTFAANESRDETV